MIMFTFVFFTVAFSIAVLGKPASLLFGESAALTGPTAQLGLMMTAGVQAAFKEANDAGGPQGISLNLKLYDDGYEPIPCKNNTEKLIDVDNVFALIGYVGTPTSAAAIAVATNRSTPYIGAFTGAGLLRFPYNQYAVNVRASYVDETAAMTNLLVGLYRHTRIAAFIQDDSFGLAGYDGIVAKLRALGMELVSEGRYTRNTLDIQAGMDKIGAAGNVEGVVMIGAYGPLAKFVKESRSHPGFSKECKYVAVSFVGAEAFRDALGTAAEYRNVFVTQVVPLPTDTRYEFVRKYRAAMAAWQPTNTPMNFVSMEGYLAGRLAIAIVERMTSFTKADLIKVVQSTRYFSVDDIELGMYAGSCPLANSTAPRSRDFVCECNQGMRQVWTSRINAQSSEYELVPDTEFVYSKHLCASPDEMLQPGAAFGLSYPLGDLIAQKRITGIRAAFAGATSRFEAGQFGLQLHNTTDTNLTDIAITKGLVGFLGNVRASDTVHDVVSFDDWPTSDIAQPLATDEKGKHLQFSLTAEEQLFFLVSYATTDFASISASHPPISLYYDSSSSWIRAAAQRALDTHTGRFESSFRAIQTHTASRRQSTDFSFASGSGESREYLVVMTDSSSVVLDALSFMSSAAGSKLILLLPLRSYSRVINSIVGSAVESRVVVVSNHPNLLPINGAFYAEYRSDVAKLSSLEKKDPVVQEGYALGRAVAAMLVSQSEAKINGSMILNSLYAQRFISLAPVTFGPFENTNNEKCASGARQVNFWRGNVSAFAPGMTHYKTSCQIQYATKPSDDSTVLIVVVVVVVLLLIVIAIVSGFLFKSKGRDNSAAPVDPEKKICISFTDIQSSTSLWGQVPEAMAPALDWHHQEMRRLIKKHNVYEVKTIGDSFMIAAESPDDMLAMALDVQESFQNHDYTSDDISLWYEQSLQEQPNPAIWKGLRIRQSIYYGFCEIRQDETTFGMDYYGDTVNMSARVEAAAHGGQLVCSKEFTTVIQNRLDVVTVDLGEHLLRGASSKVPLVQILPTSLAQRKFPPLKTQETGAEENGEEEDLVEVLTGRSHRSSMSSSKHGTYAEDPFDCKTHSLASTLPIEVIKTVLQRRYDTLKEVLAAASSQAKKAILTALCDAWRLPQPAHMNDEILYRLVKRTSETATAKQALNDEMKNATCYKSPKEYDILDSSAEHISLRADSHPNVVQNLAT